MGKSGVIEALECVYSALEKLYRSIWPSISAFVALCDFLFMTLQDSIFDSHGGECADSSHPPVLQKRRVLGLTVLGLTAGGVVALAVATAPFIAPALRRYCLPFVPATDEQVKNVITALPKKGKLADIGSGDGRIVIAAAKNGFVATGYELNPWLILYSKMPRLEEKLSKELTPGAHVAACRFPFPSWQPVRTVGSGIDTVWLYNVPSSFTR